MCIVIDINTFHAVFNPDSENHKLYQPVTEWVISGKGKIVCGGSGYLSELVKLKRFMGLFNQLKKAGKVVWADDVKVDAKEAELKLLCDDDDFDDPHIVALLIVSGCRLICTEDSRSYPYLKKKEWFPKGAALPKIYCAQSVRRAGKLLVDKNIADICLPCIRLNKVAATQLAL